MLAAIGKALAVGGIATLAYATTAVTSQFRLPRSLAKAIRRTMMRLLNIDLLAARL